MKFGAKVLGEEEFAAEQKAYEQASKQGFAYGPRVTGSATATEEAPAKATTPVAPSGAASPHLLSVKELEKALTANPSEQLLDELVAAEFDRPEGQPRKGALRLLLQAEQARGEQARAAVVAELEKALEG